jgi:hypothetical protein
MDPQLYFMQLLMNLPSWPANRHRRLASRSLETSSRCQVPGFGNTASRFLNTALHVSLTKLAERGGKNAKKRAVVAVARKLAVLLHRLWVGGEVYEPLRNSQKAMRAVA